MLAGVIDVFRARRSTMGIDDEILDDPIGGVGVREPRRPLPPAPLAGAAMLELPPLDDELT